MNAGWGDTICIGLGLLALGLFVLWADLWGMRGGYMRSTWKVPFRAVYAATFVEWARETVWSHVVVRLFPFAANFATDALLDEYCKDPPYLFEQYEPLVRGAYEARLK